MLITDEHPGLRRAVQCCREDGHEYRVFRSRRPDRKPDDVFLVWEYEDGEPTRMWLTEAGTDSLTWTGVRWSPIHQRYYSDRLGGIAYLAPASAV